ncbi:MAG: DMT family transporter [Armatimonadota bacterium]|nr:DMT family transporter [Armatimonadota bacterium]
MSKLAFTYALICVLAWGLSPVFDKFLSQELSPWAIVLMRTFVGLIIITAYAIGTGAVGELRQVWDNTVPWWMLVGAVIMSALLGSLIGQVAYYYAMAGADASRVVPITSTYPLVAAVATIIVYREPLTPHKIAGAVLIVAGVILVSGVLNRQAP